MPDLAKTSVLNLEESVPAQEIKVSNLPMVNTENVVSVYSNHAGVQISTWDVRLIFGEIVPTGEGLEIQAKANIVMTPAHAKALSMLLDQHLREFEKANGEIPWPPKKARKSEARKSRPPQSR